MFRLTSQNRETDRHGEATIADRPVFPLDSISTLQRKLSPSFVKLSPFSSLPFEIYLTALARYTLGPIISSASPVSSFSLPRAFLLRSILALFLSPPPRACFTVSLVLRRARNKSLWRAVGNSRPATSGEKVGRGRYPGAYLENLHTASSAARFKGFFVPRGRHRDTKEKRSGRLSIIKSA